VVGTSTVVALFDLIAVVALVLLAVQVSLSLLAHNRGQHADGYPYSGESLTNISSATVLSIVRHRAHHISHDESSLSLFGPTCRYSASRSQRSCTWKGHSAKLDLRLGLTGTKHPRRNARGLQQSVW
jgi:hypothetical protein